jgi:alkanesulfonate monooxygenase SsuD/methylene tetrahydromethanopterin reductase-like flavin-dependent oxidoreductase (luciferase family)
MLSSLGNTALHQDLTFGALIDDGIYSGPVARRRALVARAIDGGMHHFFGADHVSFHRGGWGVDGLIRAAQVTALHDEARVMVGVYLLALRHPMTVARQLSSISESAPGRLMLGIGVGGEDPHEFEVCGIDPRTRGRRTDEMLTILEPLLAGETIDHDGEFYTLERAEISPIPEPRVPLFVGGRADAALRRAGRFADGWLGIWSTPERYREGVARVREHAEAFGRASHCTRHGIQLWLAVDEDKAAARARLGARMQSIYRLPFEKFERYSPHGSLGEVADALAALADAGCRVFNVACVGESTEQAIDDLVALRERLTS